MEQLGLLPPAVGTPDAPPPLDPRAPHALGRWLGRALGQPVQLRVTRNRSTMLSASQRPGELVLRLHELFRHATARELEALVGYLGAGDRAAGRLLDAFIAAHSHRVARPRRSLRGRGQYHDLDVIFEELNAAYFHGGCGARITWGSGGRRRHRRSIQLGLYRVEERLISIHPSLDQAFVPRFYLTWVVYHEMLHDVFGVARRGGRRSMHPPEFAALEQTYPDFARCKRWEHENLPRLLRYLPPRRRT